MTSDDDVGRFCCPACLRMCTRGPSGTEYGHARTVAEGSAGGRCPRRPDSVDPVKETSNA